MEVTDLENQEFKNPISYYIMSEEQIRDIVRVAGEAGGKAALQKLESESKAMRKRMHDRRFHNTELLLRNYNMFKLSVVNAVYSMKQIEEEQSANEILSLMMDRNDDEFLLQSVKESKAKTIMIIKHIDTMLDIYKVHCERSADELDERRYFVLMDRYINEPTLSVKDIAEKYFISKESVYSDLKIAKERLSALIFGVDGVSMQ